MIAICKSVDSRDVEKLKKVLALAKAMRVRKELLDQKMKSLLSIPELDSASASSFYTESSESSSEVKVQVVAGKGMVDRKLHEVNKLF